MLSAGHASMLLYALLHLTGYDLPWRNSSGFAGGGSRTPGHPEHGLTPGVETTTGPLGQGFGNAVGMAMAERLLADGFNRPGHPVVDHHTYVLCSDGDLMEGAASEDASLAGHLRLGKLVCLYVDNDISIDGSTDLSFTETRAGGSRSTGGTSRAWMTATTWTPWSVRSEPRATRPIGHPWSSSAHASRSGRSPSRTPRPPTARCSARTR